ncbi:MAG TPA: carboxypeptidase-like regulatory domain-containing protein, partial [Planctomycetota bacterium]|nr:carboxypeptidase-like regulatory domain-containing protein [Planctomycetota bacterium]
RFHEATSTTSIAQELHRPRETVRKQLSRGIELLRRALPPSLFGALGLLGFGRGSPAMPLTELTRPRSPLAKLALRPRILVGISAVGLSVLVGLLWQRSDVTSTLAGPLAVERERPNLASRPTAETLAQEEAQPAAEEVRGEAPSVAPAKSETASVQLRVVEPGGRGIPDVPIVILPVDERPFFALLHAAFGDAAKLGSGTEAHGGAAIVARSDARGDLAVPGLVDGRYGFFAPGFLPGATFITRGGRGNATLTLPQDVTLRGRVVDHLGRGVASAAIFVSGSGGEQDFGTQIAEAGGDGTFELRSFIATSSFWARSPDGGYSQLVSANGALPQVMQLRIDDNDRDLAVHVRSAGDAPVPHAIVAWMPNDRRKRQAGSLLVPRHARTDADGRLVLEKLARRDALVLAYADGLASEAALARKDDRTCVLVLQRGMELSGTIRDTAGNPVAAALVSAQPVNLTPGYSTGGLMTRTTSTDADGRYRLTNLPPTPVAVLALARPRGRLQARGRAVCDLEREPTKDLIVREDAVLTGTLRPANAATRRLWRIVAIPGAGARRGMRQSWTRSVLSKADGQFELTVLRAGPHSVAAFASVDAIWPSLVFEASAGRPVDIIAP